MIKKFPNYRKKYERKICLPKYRQEVITIKNLFSVEKVFCSWKLSLSNCVTLLPVSVVSFRGNKLEELLSERSSSIWKSYTQKRLVDKIDKCFSFPDSYITPKNVMLLPYWLKANRMGPELLACGVLSFTSRSDRFLFFFFCFLFFFGGGFFFFLSKVSQYFSSFYSQKLSNMVATRQPLDHVWQLFF